MADSDSIKLCECGCGQPAPIATKTRLGRGYRRGEPIRFIHGHSQRGHGPISHGQHATRTHRCWAAMLNRCRSPKTKHYSSYGGRGIRVCERWLKFENFLADMGEQPQGKSLDRYPNNDGDYEPSNCRWATPQQQAVNRRDSIRISHDGVTKHAAEWAAEHGLQVRTILERHRRGIHPPELFAAVTGRWGR